MRKAYIVKAIRIVKSYEATIVVANDKKEAKQKALALAAEDNRWRKWGSEDDSADIYNLDIKVSRQTS